MKHNPYRPMGTVYGTLLNFQREHTLWAPRMNEAPYQAPPKAPVLYIKTANTSPRMGRQSRCRVAWKRPKSTPRWDWWRAMEACQRAACCSTMSPFPTKATTVPP